MNTYITLPVYKVDRKENFNNSWGTRQYHLLQKHSPKLSWKFSFCTGNNLINYFCTKPSSNRSGLMVSNCGARFPLPTSRSWNVSNRKLCVMIVDAPWYVPNTLIRRDLQIPSVNEEISHYSPHYRARLTAHPNDILLTLLEQPERKRLRRHLSNDLPTRFMV
jgi:hypothetical protein